MNNYLDLYHCYWEDNKRTLRLFFILLLALTIIVYGYLILDGKTEYILLSLILIFFIITITQPKLALYQFIFFLFTNMIFHWEPVILYTDLSALVVICSAMLDFLLRGSFPKSFPALFLNFIIILFALFITAVFGYNPYLAVHPILKVIFLAVTFLSVYRLSRYFELKNIIRFFFWVSVFHAVVALLMFLAEGNGGRVFGFALSTLDDILMLSFPIGLVLYLWADKSKGLKYMVGMQVVFIVLMATQSRMPVAFSFLSSLLAVYFSLKIARRKLGNKKDKHNNQQYYFILRRIKHRIGLLLWATVAISLVVLSTQPDLIKAVMLRFEKLLSFTPSGTFQFRLVLWDTALKAFWDHPLLGIGPGHFRTIHEIYPELDFNIIYRYVKGLSAHNMFFHYLAETGLLGISAFIALFVNQYRYSRQVWKKNSFTRNPEVTIILYILSILFLVTFFVEAGWMWGQVSFLFVFFLALIIRSYNDSFEN